MDYFPVAPMSEFVAGVLFRRKDTASLLEILNDETHIKDYEDELNDEWCGFLLLEDPYLFHSETVAFVKQASEHAPLLYFFNAEDHGWGYRAFDRGEEVAHFRVDYEANYRLAKAQLEAQHPGQAVHDCSVVSSQGWEGALTEARGSDAFVGQVREHVANAHPEKFASFDIDARQLAELKMLLSEHRVLGALRHEGGAAFELVARFRQLLNIDEVQWMM